MTKPKTAAPLISVYGINNCDQCRKAKAWLNQKQMVFTFHDIRVDGLTQAHLDAWFKHLPWDTLLNRRGTTWRQMSEVDRKAIVDQGTAASAILAQPTLLKRPVLTVGDTVMVGFNADLWVSLVA